MKEVIFGARLRTAVREVRAFGADIVSTAIEQRAEAVPGDNEDSFHKTVENLRTNLIDSLLDHISDRQVVADAAMNYLSAGKQDHSQESVKFIKSKAGIRRRSLWCGLFIF